MERRERLARRSRYSGSPGQLTHQVPLLLPVANDAPCSGELRVVIDVNLDVPVVGHVFHHLSR